MKNVVSTYLFWTQFKIFIVQTVEKGYKSMDMVWNCEHINIPDQFSKEKDQGVNTVKT